MTPNWIDEDRYPLGQHDDPRLLALLNGGRRALAKDGCFSLPGFVSPEGVRQAVAQMEARRAGAYRHEREHDIYFSNDFSPTSGSAPQGTASWTLTGDQLQDTVVDGVYRWPPLCQFLGALLQRPLYIVADPMACLNVMAYEMGDQLGWHFDRAEFTVTLLLQQAERGGDFEYRPGLRSASDPNPTGVARLLAGEDQAVRRPSLEPGTLNIFQGHNAAHRVTPVAGQRRRWMAVLSFMEAPGMRFSAAEQRGFYGRALGETAP